MNEVIEVHVEFNGKTHLVGHLRYLSKAHNPCSLFEYTDSWDKQTQSGEFVEQFQVVTQNYGDRKWNDFRTVMVQGLMDRSVKREANKSLPCTRPTHAT